MDKIRIVEVGPRDGLQNQAKPLPLEVRRRYAELLIAAGVKEIELGAFVRADRVPQMADSEKLLQGLDLKGARAYFLVPNEKGLERALAAGVKDIAVFTAATDGFNRANIGMSMAEALALLRKLVPAALAKGCRVRGYLSTVWGCPYDGKPAWKDISKTVGELLQLGCFEVSLGDTIGIARPAEVREVLERLAEEVPKEKLAVHLHDTRGMAAANLYVALEEGIRTIDAAAGGLGGCPFAPGAAGNVATEDVVFLTDGLGYKSGIDLDALAAASRYIHGALGLSNFSSKVLQALVAGERKSE